MIRRAAPAENDSARSAAEYSPTAGRERDESRSYASHDNPGRPKCP